MLWPPSRSLLLLPKYPGVSLLISTLSTCRQILEFRCANLWGVDEAEPRTHAHHGRKGRRMAGRLGHSGISPGLVRIWRVNTSALGEMRRVPYQRLAISPVHA